jgi:hypothetical protein
VAGTGNLGGRCLAGAGAGAGGKLYLLGGETAPFVGATCPFAEQAIIAEVATYQP